MKILVVNNYFPEHIGGIEFAAYNLVSMFRRNHTVHWMASDVEQNPHVASTDDVPLRSLNFTETHLGFPYPIPVLASYPCVIHEVIWCDIIHLHDCLYAVNIIVYILSRIFKKPVLITQHISPVPYRQAYKNRLQAIAYGTIGKLLLTHSEEVVFISQRVLEWFVGQLHLNTRPNLILNGVDHRLFHPVQNNERKGIRKQLQLPDDRPVIVFVGRFTEKKGLDMIREAAERAQRYLWVLIGRVDGLDPRDWKLANIKVIPPLSQSELRKYYVASDLLALPSIGEGIPLALQEAMSCGTPAVVSDEIYGTLPDAPLLKLVDNCASSLLLTIDHYFSIPEEIGNWRMNVCNYAQSHWSWEAAGNSYENLFLRLKHG